MRNCRIWSAHAQKAGGPAGAMVLPGEVVAVPADARLGRGLYRSEEDGLVRASLRGELLVEGDADATRTPAQSPAAEPAALVARVLPPNASSAPVPSVGQTVVGRVTRLCQRHAAVDILFIDAESAAAGGAQWLGEPFRATLRATDIWPTGTRDAPALIANAVRPGDLVRARVIGVGDASAGFLVATGGALLVAPAEYAALSAGGGVGLQVQCVNVEHLGVVHALSQAGGAPMAASAWNEMICPATGTREPRRAARPRVQ